MQWRSRIAVLLLCAVFARCSGVLAYPGASSLDLPPLFDDKASDFQEAPQLLVQLTAPSQSDAVDVTRYRAGFASFPPWMEDLEFLGNVQSLLFGFSSAGGGCPHAASRAPSSPQFLQRMAAQRFGPSIISLMGYGYDQDSDVFDDGEVDVVFMSAYQPAAVNPAQQPGVYSFPAGASKMNAAGIFQGTIYLDGGDVYDEDFQLEQGLYEDGAYEDGEADYDADEDEGDDYAYGGEDVYGDDYVEGGDSEGLNGPLYFGVDSMGDGLFPSMNWAVEDEDEGDLNWGLLAFLFLTSACVITWSALLASCMSLRNASMGQGTRYATTNTDLYTPLNGSKGVDVENDTIEVAAKHALQGEYITIQYVPLRSE